jgi:hypothetical protein
VYHHSQISAIDAKRGLHKMVLVVYVLAAEAANT